MPDGSPAGPAPHGAGPARVRIDLAYDGTDFAGWARQPGQRTVQETVERALATVLRIPATAVTVAGRTDAGVHATGQVCSADLPRLPQVRSLNAVLPPDVRVRRAVAAPAAFDARFAATARHYRYRIADRPDGLNPLRRRDTLHWRRPLEEEAMREAAQALLGEHDFLPFCRPRPGASTVRRVLTLEVARTADAVLAVEIAADAFCHHMVRSIVGALLAVGERRRDASWLRELLVGGERNSAVFVAPPHGLTLVAVDYPPDAELAARGAVTRRLRGPAAPSRPG